MTKIKRIDKSMRLPEYETGGSVGFDLYNRTDVYIVPGEILDIPLNVVIDTDPTHVLLLVLRSSTPKKYGIIMPHSCGIIDSDYCGDEDEIILRVYNFTDTPQSIPKGTRIAQGVFVPRYRADWQEVDSMDADSRGGFGSTGERING